MNYKRQKTIYRFIHFLVTKNMNYILTSDLSSFIQLTQLFLSHPLLHQLYPFLLVFLDDINPLNLMLWATWS